VIVTQDFKDMCRVTGAPEVVRPHQYYPSNNGDDVRPRLSLPSKSSLRRSPSPKSVVPSSQTKKSVRVRFAEAAAVPSQVSSQRFEKAKDAQIPCEPSVLLTTTYEGILPRASTMSPSEKGDIWWQTRDYDIFSGTARLIAGEIRRRAAAISAAADRSVSSQEDGGGSNTRDHAESYAAVLTQVLQACSLAAASSSATTGNEEDDIDIKAHPLDPNLFAYLAHWTRSGHSRRGLERWSVAYHGPKRNADRGAQIQAVLIAQASTLAEEGQDDKIKAASEAHSKAARLFALAIGQADAAAVNANS